MPTPRKPTKEEKDIINGINTEDIKTDLSQKVVLEKMKYTPPQCIKHF